jgi:heme iron utilization protein
MLGDPNVALMIMEPETDMKPPHTLVRVSMQGRAEPISQDDPRFGAAGAAYSARFPDMVGLFELGDFTLFAIAPATVRVIAGFALAASITPASFARSVRHSGQ